MSKKLLLASVALAITVFAQPMFAADAPANAPKADPVVARVNGQEIHRSEVENALQNLPPQAQQMPIQTLYPKLLESLISAKLVAEKGYAEHLQNDKEVKDRLKGAEAEIVAGVYVHRTIMPKITDDKIKQKYDEYVKNQFKSEDEVRARHILIKVAPNASADDSAKAEQTAEDLIKQIKGGADFAKLAEEKSDDKGSATHGGDLGYFSQKMMVKPFADAAFSMKAGEITDKPIKTDFGYHIIKVEDRRKSSPPTLADLHDQLANQIGQEMTQKMVADLVANAKVERYNPDGTPLKTAEAPAK